MASTKIKNTGASSWYVEVRSDRTNPTRKPAFVPDPTLGDHSLPAGDSRNPGTRHWNPNVVKPGSILFLRAESTDAAPFSFHPGDLPIERMWIDRVDDKWEITILLKEDDGCKDDGRGSHDPEVKHPDG